jgi:TatD DNase family protein
MKKITKFIDTHSHPYLIKALWDKKKENSLCFDELEKKLNEKSIEKIICISTDINDYELYKYLSKKYNKYYFTVGIHPCDIDEDAIKFKIDSIFKIINESLINNEKIVGIGEIGIDLYHSNLNFDLQKKAFFSFLEMAANFDLPIVVHTRNANEETYNILSYFKKNNPKLRGVIHCFGDNTYWAKKWIDLDFYLGIGGIVTYPSNRALRDCIKEIGINNFVLETDSPFLPIQKKRGDINTSESIPEINEYIANLLEINYEDSAKIFYENSNKLFTRLNL